MRFFAAALMALLLSPPLAAAPVMPMRSFNRLLTSNGFAVASYNRTAGKIDFFLEHPYRFASPNNPGATDLCFTATESRNLAFDTYYGWRAASNMTQEGVWLPSMNLQDVRYIPGTGIIHATHAWNAGTGRLAGQTIKSETWSFMPMSVSDPVLLQVVQFTNQGTQPIQLTPYALYNFHLGVANGQVPDANGENATYDATRHAFYEWGPRPPHGTMAYVALTPEARRTVSGGTNNAYVTLQANGDLDNNAATTAATNDVVPAFEWSTTTLMPGATLAIASAVVWAADENAAPHVDNLVSWVGGRDPMTLVTDEQNAWASWHTTPPSGLSQDQQDLWRQQAAFIRMAQVQEPGAGHGAIMASLPPALGNVDGTWNITWVRDMAYAVVALARTGHLKEALDAITFQVNAGPGRHTTEVGQPYRLSVTRYFGDGEEESDCNMNGPNIEFDGWGLFMWSVGEYLRAGGDPNAIQAMWSTISTEIADVLVSLVDADGLISADSSIWEVHWDGQQKHFTYTSLAAARGLAEIAAVAQRLGQADAAERYLAAAEQVRDAVVEHNVDPTGVLAQSPEALATGMGYVDASAAEAINWGVISPTGTVATATVAAIEQNLRVASGNGFMRNQAGSFYDSQEWGFIDLRMVPVLRANGDDAGANELLSWIEQQALQNDFHIPELLDPKTGAYEGSVPMVGFGAAAYLIAWSGLAMPAVAGQYGDRPHPPDAGVDAGSSAVDAGAMTMPDGGAAADSGMHVVPSGSGCGCGSAEPAGAALALLLAARRRRRR